MSEPIFAGIQPGMVLAERFRVERFLAGGGMGDVYEAVDLELDEKVAIKAIRPELAENERTRKRFRREILFSRKVTHPSVCRVFEVFQHKGEGTSPDVVFLTMELLEGETLKQRLKKGGALRPEQALPILSQVAEAVQVAHEKGIVHRDLKCSNIMLVPREGGAEKPDERVVVMDFGIARWHPTRDGSSVVGGSTITAAGHLLGTPDTMAPEQLTGGKVTPATDVYAFGVVAYQAVTGHKPFEGVDMMDAVFKRLHEDPTPIRRHAPDLPESWVRAIGHCLQRDPSARPASMRDAVAGFDAPPRRRWRWAVAAALLVAFVLFAFFLARPREDASTPLPAAENTAEVKEARPALAILGFRDRQDREDTAWIGTVVAEMLAAELTTDALRPVSGDNVARMLRELGLQDAGSLTAAERRKIHEQLGTSLLVHGAYHAGGGRLRFDITVERIPGDTTEVLLMEEAAEDDLAALVERTGEKLRGELGLGPGSGKVAKMPEDLEATRLYAEGLRQLRLWDTPGARDLLEKSVQLEPSALAWTALAEAWARLGNRKESEAASAEAYALRDELAFEDRMVVEARYHRSRAEWETAITCYEALLERFPDNLEYGLAYASTLRSATRLDDSRSYLERLRQSVNVPVDRIRIDVGRSRTEYTAGEYQDARRLTADAAMRAEELGARWLQAQALYIRAVTERRLELYDEAEAALDVAEPAFRELGDARYLGRTLQNRGNLLINLQRHDEAQRYLEDALDAFRQAGDDGGLAGVYQSLGVVLQDQGELQEARVSYERAIELCREGGHRGTLIYCLNSYGLVTRRLGDLALARKSYEEALEIARERGNAYEISMPLTNLANLLRQQFEYDAAREAYHEAIELLKTNNSGPHSLALRLNGLADLYYETGDLDEALRLHTEAAEKIAQGTPQHASTLRLLAGIHRERGDLETARTLLEESLRMHEGLSSPLEEAMTQADVAEIVLLEGRPREAHRLSEEALATVVEADSKDREIVVRGLLIRSAEDAAAARRIYEELQDVDSANPLAVQQHRAMEARVLAREGRREDARRIAEELVAECTEKGMVARALEYRLLLVGITGEGVEELERDARERGFLLTAEQAAVHR